MTKRTKSKRGRENLVKLGSLCLAHGIRLQIFTDRHARLFGASTVDYWPTTGRYWLTGSNERAKSGTPEEAVQLATRPRLVVEQEAAVSHMKSISLEDSEISDVPW